MTTRLAQNFRLLVVVLAVTSLSGCATLSADEQEEHRAELDEMGDRAIAKLLETRPEISELLEQCVGYAVIKMQVTKIPLIGGGGGYGVVRDQISGDRSYIKVSRFEVGGGMGTQKFKVIILFSDQKLLKRAITGSWHFEAGPEAVAGESSIEDNLNKSGEGYSAFRIGESGAVATVTIRVARATPYLE